MPDNYAKIEPPYHEKDVDGVRIPAALVGGFCARRASWPEGTFIFLARSANYSAQDGVTGMLSEFLVKHVGNKDMPYEAKADDFTSNDWEIYTRQQTHRFPRFEERNTRVVEEVIEP
jgi:hypothetical protein